MNAKKKFPEISIFSLIISSFFSTSLYFYLFQEINVSKRGLALWFVMFLVLYIGFSILEKIKVIQNWKAFDKKSKILLILLIPIIGFFIFSITNFDPPNAILLLPKHQVIIKSSQNNNPLSSGSVIEINGIKNGGDWISLKSIPVDGDFDLLEYSLILNGYPAEINYLERIIDKLEINFITRPDGGIVKIVTNGEEKEIDLFSETIQPKPVSWFFPTPLAITFFLTLLYSISIGLLIFLIALIIFFPKLSTVFAQIDKTDEGVISLDSLLLSTSLFIFIFIFLEWLFQVTKPSFMNYYGFSEKLIILLSSFSILSFLLIIVFFLLYRLFSLLSKKSLTKQIIRAMTIFPAVILSITILLLIDNFSYTIFKFGIVSATGIIRAVYGLFFLTLIAIIFSGVVRITDSISRLKRKKVLAILVFSFISISSLVIFFNNNNPLNTLGKEVLDNKTGSGSLPNIIYITADGLSAKNMSLYGYERDTTPRLLELSESSLVAANAFTNSGASSGSMISVYTSKYPSETRVLYPPDILQGKDSYESLLAILRTHGYYSVQMATPYFIDAYDQNLIFGFNIINGRSNGENKISLLIPQETYYFIDLIKNRMIDRLYHIFYFKNMMNVFENVSSEAQAFSDQEKIIELMNLINDNSEPLFIHAHLVGTHGPYFNPSEQIFSKGQEKEKWDLDFYDDSIHEFDSFVGLVIDELTAKNKLDNTMIIIGSDHGMRWSLIERIPLLIRFPGGDYAGLINGNVQNLDIAPTILDYLNIEIPAWMEGISLLTKKEDLTNDPVFSFWVQQVSQNQIDYKKVVPPFYQFGDIYLIYCQNWFRLNLQSYQVTSGVIMDYKNPCAEEDLLSNEKAFAYMKDHLQEKGFDTTSLVFNVTP